MQNWLNNETDKLQMRNIVINRINNEINDFFENNRTLENILNVKGDWGTGKTTVVTHLEENFKINNNKNIKFHIINLWKYETVSNPYASLVKDLLYKINPDLDLENLNETNKTNKVTKWFFKTSLSIPYTPLSISGGIQRTKTENIEVDLDSLTNDAIDSLINFINKNDKKIVFIFDELDRCTHENQIKLLSYIKNIFFKITNIFFIVSCNSDYIDSRLSLSNNNSESYTHKLFNKTIDLNLIIPSHKGIFTKNEFINKFIKEIYNNNKITLSPREINSWLEKTDTIFLNFKNDNNKPLQQKAWGKDFFIYQEIEEEIKFIIFFCLYVKNKEKKYYYEIIDKDNFMPSNGFNLLMNFFKNSLNKETTYNNNFNQEKLMQLINNNKWEEPFAPNDNVFLGWKDVVRNKYSFHFFSLLPFILPIIDDKNINNFFEKQNSKYHYLKNLSRRSYYNIYNDTYTNILFKYEKEELPGFLRLFLDILWEIPYFKYKNNIWINSENEDIRLPVIHYFNYKYIFNIIEKTIFY